MQVARENSTGQMPVDKVLTPDRFMDYEQEVKGSRLVDLALARIVRDGMEVCDIGGASGVFLGELLNRSKYHFNATLLEVVDEYRVRLVDERINYRLASVLDNDIPDGSFDMITFRHIIHHLVADNIVKTLDNQRRAFEQIFRMVRPGGYLVFQEQVHYVRLFARMVYHMSLLANKMRIRSRFFDAGTVVVAFPTTEEIKCFLDANKSACAFAIEEYFNEPKNMPLRWKLTLLMKNVGDLTYVIKVNGKKGGTP
ncbi:MAG: class I SAM-dependent methyltransferase [Verrucomicrobia bacterium]|nr:class I SAM-dependent methyltransferase [Verrucomicrobiota bacterium]MBU1735259.1 class I SAM-dependent methyltransferase [Verrucomicrobiota bacterium]MBU1856474.1 class I SAM-dependent methyltransferase [Verrucomicrobiota bacterium]